MKGNPKEEGLSELRLELFEGCDVAEGHETPFVRDLKSGRQWFVEEFRKDQLRVGPQWFARDEAVEQGDVFTAWTKLSRLEPFEDLRSDDWLSWYELYQRGQ